MITLDPVIMRATGAVVEALHLDNVKTATKFLEENYVVRATWQRKRSGRDWQNTILLTLGQPNYLGRQFIKDCKKAGVPFPVRKVQLKFWPKKRK